MADTFQGTVTALSNAYNASQAALAAAMTQFKAAGGTLPAAFAQKVADHVASAARRLAALPADDPAAYAVAAVALNQTLLNEIRDLGVEYRGITGTDPVAPNLPPTESWSPSIGWIIKWGLVAGVIYIGYKWFTAAGQASERIRYVRENHSDYIPTNELPAYAGGPRRHRRRK